MLKGRNMTSYPSIKTDLKNAGVNWEDKEVIVDQGLVTSRSPKDLDAFNKKMIEEIGEGIISSSSLLRELTFDAGFKIRPIGAFKLKGKEREAMGHLGKLTSLTDLPPQKEFAAYIKEAMQINEAGKKVPLKRVTADEIEVPEILQKALRKNRTAKEHFDAFSPSQKKEYITWINEAKTEPTREKRLSTTIEWLEEGKIRNWKYVR